jgi:ribosome-associated translation inhibitor RaiA/cold shock CspA family protein
MELQIDGQNVVVHDDLRAVIVDRLEKLNARHGDIIHARVSLIKSSHHQQGSDEVRIFLSMNRRKTLQASKMGKTLEEAVGNTFEVLTRELAEYRNKRRELNKQRLKTVKVGPRLTGKVVQIAADKGYGYIDIGAEEAVHFSRHTVVGETFDSITEGMSVEVDVVEADQGLEATRVVPL